ncbi:hypothetical protein E6A55_04460 [Cupriavidus necator H16]|uniref:Uncharacterized protein n=1 Tax=Cupriavidus necator (strain ATCC 17699 / DSM 428 / KCTC 22496 / NCIMB 10442 / H16 / Stanier 337) TaxID=381666 RepID=A0AAE5ZCS0_CUPNH|nr:hypothetical protein [Cupriavidus necator]QCB99945.1 hypothetical protein E6A55_04460 [Cupriavidus necator H16]QQB77239.1 hypothetical protein I6H87_02615 [Cupriavidus necator]WKA41795.1 hypothetical protein QWP09_04440 [Cupriavidus necator]
MTALQAAIKSWLMRAKPNCLIHPHGFYVVMLGRDDSAEWRLHFWPPGRRPVTGMPAYIHTHNCHVDSRIIKGEITNILYDVAERPADGQPLYEVDYIGDRYAAATRNVLRKTVNRVQATARAQCTYACGDVYHVERDTYHQAMVSEQIRTATLVCMRERSLGPVRVVGLDGYPEIISFTRNEYQSLDFCEWL